MELEKKTSLAVELQSKPICVHLKTSGRDFYIHKEIAEAKSEYFQHLLSSGSKETHDGKIELHFSREFDEAFDTVAEYMYYDRYKPKVGDGEGLVQFLDVIKVYVLADRLLMSDLKHSAFAALKRILDKADLDIFEMYLKASKRLGPKFTLTLGGVSAMPITQEGTAITISVANEGSAAGFNVTSDGTVQSNVDDDWGFGTVSSRKKKKKKKKKSTFVWGDSSAEEEKPTKAPVHEALKVTHIQPEDLGRAYRILYHEEIDITEDEDEEASLPPSEDRPGGDEAGQYTKEIAPSNSESEDIDPRRPAQLLFSFYLSKNKSILEKCPDYKSIMSEGGDFAIDVLTFLL